MINCSEVDEGATLSTPLLPVVRDTRSMEWNVAPLIAVQLARATSDVALSPHSRARPLLELLDGRLANLSAFLLSF